ncbi:MAG: SDR family oxidoreductase [Chloroflexota bacterium]
MLITGAGTGLGKETALYLARQGHDVWACVLSDAQEETLREAAAERGLDLRVEQMDVTRDESVHAVVDRMRQDGGGIYGLVNNAGIALRGYFEDLDDQEIRDVFDVNVFGAMRVTRAVLPAMREARRGRIIMVTSIGGRIGSLAVSAYSSSKFALEGFGESLYQEVKPLGIHVSLVAPAIVKTERFGANRGYARNAFREDGPYQAWFTESQRLTDRLVESSKTSPADVARVIHKALTAKKPRLRYTVGGRARLILSLRKHLPGELFERLYFGEAMRRVTRGGTATDAGRSDSTHKT